MDAKENTMPLYKEYSQGAPTEGRRVGFPLYKDRKDDTHCIDDTQVNRFYPDEWLEYAALEKFLKLRNQNNKNIVLIPETWAGNGRPERGNAVRRRMGEKPEDEGFSSSAAYSEQILNAVDQAIEKNEDTLIMVAYTYQWHEMGMSILVTKDPKERKAIFIDPYGKAPSAEDIIRLETRLKNKNFQIETVAAQQQPRFTTICAFVFTASCFKFIEEFIKTNRITSEGFQHYKPNMVSAYMFHMYVNNYDQFNDDVKPIVNEIMLATPDLWEHFIKEQNLKDANEIIKLLRNTLRTQETFLINTVSKEKEEEEPLNQLKLNVLRDFQQKLIELIFIKPADLLEKIKALTTCAYQLIQSGSLSEFNVYYLYNQTHLKLDNLLSDPLFDDIKLALKFDPPRSDHLFKSDISQDAFKPIIQQYQSTSYLRWFSPNRSKAIQELKKLENHTNITKTEVENAVCKDSQRRLTLFQCPNELTANNTSTDKVIIQLGKTFRA